MMRDFDNDGGRMVFGGMHACDIADEFGTPVYVTDESILRENYRRIWEAFNRHMETDIHYACKANTNLAVLRILEQEGSGIDAVSIGEVLTCLRAGYSPDRIIFTGVNVGDQELREVAETGVMINIDSFSEMERLAELCPNASEQKVSIRITPGVGSGHGAKVITGNKGSKFGIPMNEVLNAYIRANDLGFDIRGIHAHIGSGGQTVEPFIDLMQILIDTSNAVSDAIGVGLEFIDMGGGIGVPYKPNEEEMDVEELSMTLTDMIAEESEVSRLIVEPGRYIVCDSTILLTRCVDVKDAGTKKYVGVDAGFNTLVRPAFYDSYHHVAIANKFNRACTGRYDIVGPVCETGDYLAHDRVLPDPEEGDLIAVYDAGAYGFSMSSRYNSRPLCGEVLVNEGRAELIREAENMEDLWRHQIVPGRLER